MTKTSREIKKAWLLVLGNAAFIFGVSSIPQQALPIDPRLQIVHADWLFHMLEYSLFGFLLMRAFTVTYDYRPPLVAAVFLIGALYGLSDEWHQRFVQGRDSSVGDAIADSAGTALGIIAWLKKKGKEHA